MKNLLTNPATAARGGALLATACLTGFAVAQPIVRGPVVLQLEPVASGLTGPVHLTNAGDGSGRLFVLEQPGRVRIIQNGVLLATPFLDISGDLPVLATNFDERGLLGLAFHPNYEQNGRFFVRHSRPRPGMAGEPCFGTSRGCHEEVVEEFHVSASNPDVADPAGHILFRVDKPQFNHNGAHIAFGPDGFLYFTFGDGGGANDGLADNPPSHGPIGNAQNINVPLGKMLRIDVDNVPPLAPYGIPANNPFVNGPGLDEIYAYGLRNPYRFSFDDGPGGTGRLIVADVGQNLFEEINYVKRGGNYGWVFREGFNCFDPFMPAIPPPSCRTDGFFSEALMDPIAEYPHSEGISITGGYVYRGPRFPARGLYIFGDWSRSFAQPQGRILYLNVDETGEGERGQIFEPRIGFSNQPLARRVMGFGVDEAGDIYLCTQISAGPAGVTGEVFRVLAACAGDVDGDRLVNESDLGQLLTAFGVGPGADFDGNGVTDEADLGVLLANWNRSCP